MHTQDQAKANLYTAAPAPARVAVNLPIFDAFVMRLATHDWYYDHSDDGSVWRRGHSNHQQLVQVAKGHPTLQHAFDAFNKNAHFGMPDEERDSIVSTLRQDLMRKSLLAA
jgi:hypothetical protein